MISVIKLKRNTYFFLYLFPLVLETNWEQGNKITVNQGCVTFERPIKHSGHKKLHYLRCESTKPSRKSVYTNSIQWSIVCPYTSVVCLRSACFVREVRLHREQPQSISFSLVLYICLPSDTVPFPCILRFCQLDRKIQHKIFGFSGTLHN